MEAISRPAPAATFAPPRSVPIAMARSETPDVVEIPKVAVASAEAGSRASNDGRRPDNGSSAPPAGDRNASTAPKLARMVEQDSRTKEVVFKVIDTDTGEIKRQVPEESLLRLRAIVDQMTKPPSDNARPNLGLGIYG